MEKKLIATHKYKTRVIFLDDDVDFLEVIQDALNSPAYEVMVVNNYQDFTQLITDSVQAKDNLPSILESMDNEVSDLNDNEALRFNLSKFKEIKHILDRTKEIAVVVVDNNLGEQNGTLM
jgi:CheY-like chemotaxis protein